VLDHGPWVWEVHVTAVAGCKFGLWDVGFEDQWKILERLRRAVGVQVLVMCVASAFVMS